ncbi:MAG TPA: hypothetical protein VMU26_17275 [Candidatus Polarisedimenticolia bacterium]|nr:hypothetical protein [Candidatus Polarisedimenticolia bacterium]
MPFSLASASITTSASPVPPPMRFLTFAALPHRFDLARCLSLQCQRVVAADHTVILGPQSIALPP